ncbi:MULTISPECIES: hypothetical protein [Pseudoalteromonas]|uniref:hypothetical protein n=1 Tax=Pseudoalteromonas TaxID=53246 RepID=UPI0008241A74|nr:MULTISPECIES: hypothetical protein [Pseudoalteromonas]
MEADKNTSNAVSSTRPLNIVCPDCEEENTLEYGNHIKCHKCEKSFAGHTYQKFKKPFLTAKFALFIGAVGAYKLDREFLEPKRYSTGAIVEIVSFCSNPRARLSNNDQIVTAKMCICALDRTMKEVPEAELASNKKLFITEFANNLNQCR